MKKMHLIGLALLAISGCQKSNNDSSQAGGGQTSGPWTLSVAKAGTGTGKVRTSPAGVDCGASCSGQFANGTAVTLTAEADGGMVFNGLSGGGCTGAPCVLTLTADVNVTATFVDPAAAQKTLLVSRTGAGSGTVTSSPGGISCGSDCAENFATGVSVTLTAIPLSGSLFAGWTGGGCSGTGSCVLPMSDNTTVTAEFAVAPPATFVMTVTREGTGGGIISSTPPGIACGTDCTEAFANGSTVELTAAPDGVSTFTGWGGACSGTGVCAVTMSEARLVSAGFTKITYPLTVAKAGTGTGTVTSAPIGINCGTSCSAAYEKDEAVSLSVVPNPSADFGGWTGDCSGAGPCVVSMSGPKSVGATFVAKQRITVAKTGGGVGTVVSVPSGIDCGATCATLFSFGQTVSLTATPASGYKFSGWSGEGCSGTGSCAVVADQARNVTASFVPDYSGTWQGLTNQFYPMSFVVVDNGVTTYSHIISVPGCGVISSTTTFGTPLNIVAGSFNSGGSTSYIKGTFGSVTSATGEIKADYYSWCYVRPIVTWSASRALVGAYGLKTPGASQPSSKVLKREEFVNDEGNRVVVELRSE